MRRLTFLNILMVLTLATASGCVAIPVRSTSSGTGTPGVPVVEVETASIPAATPTTGLPAPEASRAVATVEPTAETSATSPATAPAPTEMPALVSTPATAIEHYQGPNPYRATPMFDVAYDTARWEYVEDDGSGRQSQLKHRIIAGCTIWLRSGPVDAKKVADVYLADRAWSLVQVQPKIIQYVAPQDDFAWIFGLILPEEYTGMANSDCQDAAEQVMQTFKVVPE